MQVSNTLNNSIRILFNPTIENFKLFDFLMVKSNKDKYIAEIVEIYDDKFDSSQDVAKLKLFYKINENNEVLPYDHFTPNKECEIIKIKQEEIEKFINQDRETFPFATNVKNSEPLNLQYDFFNKNAVIMADKIENSNAITLTLAKKLSSKKHTIIIDSTGMIDSTGAKKITACKNIKLPLNFTTINYVFEKCLSDASLEFQATGSQILNEIKKFAKKQEEGFISFNAFTRVLLEQYKATPYPELKLLLARMKKHQMSEIFATNKRDYENLFKTINNNSLTIVDLSEIESAWQKAYLEYIIQELKNEVYLITRINDENCDVDIINKIYCKKRNITFIPSVSYNYKKLPSIAQYCRNYILLPSLYQRSDFLNANFALSNLIQEGCIIFGENTDNFLYLAKNYELEAPIEKRENYRKIALSLIEDPEEETLEQELGQKGDYFENIKKENAKRTDSERLIEELSKFEEEANAHEIVQEFEENNVEEKEDSSNDFFNDIMSNNDDEAEKIEEIKEEKDDFEDIDNRETLTEEETETEEEEQEQEEESSISNFKIDKNAVTLEEIEETEELEIKTPEDKEKDNFEDILAKEVEEEKPEKETEEAESLEEEQQEQEEEKQEEAVDVLQADLIDPDTIDLEELAKNSQSDSKGEIKEEAQFDNVINLNDSNEETEETLGDDELDFFELAKTEKEEAEEENINLEELANDSIEENFEEIVNSKPKKEAQTIAIDKDINISSDILENPAENPTLPIFKEEKKEENEMPEFKEGDIIIHPKYGRGKIIKTLKHEQRQLVHVDFEESDKKLLDPKVANIKLEQ